MTYSAAQKTVQDFLDTLVRDGHERGIQVAAYHDGRLVVDAWAGVADAATGRAVDGNTLFPVFSVTKGIAATMAHVLAERGLLDYDMPIAELWPEFAAHGKGRITIRHALSHTAGLPFMPMGLGYRELGSWRTMCRAMADLEPAWPAGSRMQYHAVTYSWLVGEVVCRAAGRSFEEALADEIRRPLGLRNMFVGIPDEVEPRVAVLDEIFEPGKEPAAVDDSQPQAVPGWLQPLHTMMNRPDARRSCVPASTGIMTARDLARHYAALVPGGVDGVELLPPERIRQAIELQPPRKNPDGSDAPQFGLGYALGDEGWGVPLPIVAFGHPGYGGSLGFAAPEHRLAVGLAKNLYSARGSQAKVVRRLFSALGIAP